MDFINNLLIKNGLVVAFLVVGIIVSFADWFSKNVIRNKVPGTAVAIIIGLILAYIGGIITCGNKGISDIKIFSGFELFGGSMFRDFAIVSSAIGANFIIIKKTGFAGAFSVFIGVLIPFFAGSLIAIALGYKDAASITTIGAGACSFIVGSVTGTAIGANSAIIAISIAAGVVKSIFVTIVTPIIAARIGLNNPQSAMVYGGLMGTTSGTAAGLAATDPKLVPYGAMTATFHTGLGCLMCPSFLFLLVKVFYP